ncbi:hypothetical protein [Chryseobacterium sp. JUb7]|uniref:hypothetical protein n=1 Tax=Chryseobacterium sp. JUb7 TaxID=2940599 RepID=UPI0021699ABC|nr:hypothetical protein [Chryseobacterium sp. JUb7]MCS3530264.1 hypothetical protein [Chryseobacterium sp. JUb7]
MKKLIFGSLLMISMVTFAKTAETNPTSDFLKKEDKVLVAKKTIQSEGNEVKKITVTAKKAIDPCVIAVVVPPPTNLDALLACLKSISDSVQP